MGAQYTSSFKIKFYIRSCTRHGLGYLIMAGFLEYLFGKKGSNGEDEQKSEKGSDNPFMSLLSGMDNFEESLFNSYKQAADAGDVKAQYNTAVSYERGTGVEKDLAKARMYYAMASMQGHPFATHNLGMLYYFGNGGEQDFERAFSYFSSAAATGDSLALAALSVCYEMGIGVEQNLEEAERLMKKAISQPNASEVGLSILAENMRAAVIK